MSEPRWERVRLIDFHQDAQRPFSYYLQLLQNRGYAYATMWLPHDAQAKSLGTGRSIEEMARNDMAKDKLTPDKHAAIMLARGAMFERLEAEYPGEGVYAVAVAGSLCDLLNNASMAPALAPLIDGQLMGTRYTPGERRPN